jgi:hypothetical protein
MNANPEDFSLAAFVGNDPAHGDYPRIELDHQKVSAAPDEGLVDIPQIIEAARIFSLWQIKRNRRVCGFTEMGDLAERPHRGPI